MFVFVFNKKLVFPETSQFTPDRRDEKSTEEQMYYFLPLGRGKKMKQGIEFYPNAISNRSFNAIHQQKKR